MKKHDDIDSILIDYMENEVPEALGSDLKLLVANSTARQKVFQSFAETRKIISSTAMKTPDLGEDFFNQLHGKIMSQVATQKPHNRGRLWLEEQSWQRFVAAGLMAVVSGSIILSLLNPTVKLESAGLERGSDMLLSLSVEVPEAFADSLLNDRDSADFLMNAMVEKVAHLEEKPAGDLIDLIGETKK